MAGGEWVTVVLADGSTRQDWVPDEQPDTGNAGPGRWHVVTEGATHRWEWHPAPHLADEPALPPVPRRWVREAVAVVLAAAALFTLPLWRGPAREVAVGVAEKVGMADPRKDLHRTAQAYVDAFFSGKLQRVLTFQDPVTCTRQDHEDLMQGLLMVGNLLRGVSVRVDAVEVTGNTGRMVRFRLNDDAPPAARELFDSEGKEPDDTTFVRRDGKWFVRCERGSSSPSANPEIEF